MDYQKLGLKVGIEIHQQVDTNKLFCSCKSIIREDAPDFTIKRKLRAAAGEIGAIDIAALLEMEKNLTFVYEGYKGSTCLVETDSEPPNEINKEALDVALQTAMLLNAKPIDLIQVMRKTVVDGSNTSGFQRTALIAADGKIETSLGKVRIATVCLEEDSARLIKIENSTVYFRLDRLGIPLVEIATEADIKTPEHCKETAEKIGLILRSTKVKRGLGTIRQDVNVSIKEGSRIEIKGAQDLSMLPKLVENEALRQIKLLEIKKELEGINANQSDIKPDFHDISETLKHSESAIIRNALKTGIILAVKLPKFAGLLGFEVNPNRRLASEFSDYVKIKTGLGGLFHSDELPKYGISQEEVDKIRKKLNCKSEDGFVLVAGDKDKCYKALNAVIERAKLCFIKIPEEVRKANADGTTSFLRPIPGSARMYPETDVPLIKPDLSRIVLPETIEYKITKYEKLGLSPDLAKSLAKSNKAGLFESLIKLKNLKPAYIAETLVSYGPELRRSFNLSSEKITEEHLKSLFAALDEQMIAKESVLPILAETAETGSLNIEKRKALSDKDLEAEIKEIVKQNQKLELNALIGAVMSKLRGKAPGNKIVEIVKKLKK